MNNPMGYQVNCKCFKATRPSDFINSSLIPPILTTSRLQKVKSTLTENQRLADGVHIPPNG